jgi:pimeloyl-ACP methyl ester carboxylesterase
MQAMTLLFRVLVLGLIALPAHGQPATAPSDAAPANAKARPVVLVHGGWGGGWALKPIENHLRAAGYTVYRPSLFGTGETAHLASPQIGLDTHIQQIVNLIEYEDLEDVVLIGYSYSGMVVTGVVDRIPQRIRRVIYIDAFLPENGESALSFVPGMHSAFAQQLAFAIKASELFGLVPAFWESPGATPPRQDPQPLKTLTDPIVLRNPAARAVPGAYLQFVPEGLQPEQADFGASAARAGARQWPVVVMTGEHSKPNINPEPVARQILAFIEER